MTHYVMFPADTTTMEGERVKATLLHNLFSRSRVVLYHGAPHWYEKRCNVDYVQIHFTSMGSYQKEIVPFNAHMRSPSSGKLQTLVLLQLNT